MNGIRAFREAFMSSDLLDETNFSDFEARKLRYQIYWAFFENTAYDDLHSWAVALRTQSGLYKAIRGVYNPAFRIGQFYQSHLMGGHLDPNVGDGKQVESALPVFTENDNLRPALARLYRDSSWAVAKDIYSLYGSTLGDVGIQIVDDPVRQKVYLQIVHPGIIKDVELDNMGNVKGYEIEEYRVDPEDPKGERSVKYNEIAERDGDFVVYRTLRQGKLYPWNGPEVGAEWRESYGFVPLVMVQHFNVGLKWGWAEIHPGRGKIQEVDDLGSKISDQIRKAVDPIWLFAGVKKPTTNPVIQSDDWTEDNPKPEREDVRALYTDKEGATAQAVVSELALADAISHTRGILDNLEEDYPELKLKGIELTGSSGRAVRIAREEPEAKVIHRRAGYDGGLIRASQMGVAIGGFRNYDGYQGFGLDSYDAGNLEFRIGERPVFSLDPLDDLEIEKALYDAVEVAARSGIPAEVVLKRNGWSDEDLKGLPTARLAAIQAQQEDFIPQVGK